MTPSAEDVSLETADHDATERLKSAAGQRIAGRIATALTARPLWIEGLDGTTEDAPHIREQFA